MSDAQLIGEGLNLMLAGMGTVFVFLTVLVFAVGAMSRVIAQLPKDPEPVAAATAPSAAPASSPHADPQLLAILSAAVQAHREARKRGK